MALSAAACTGRPDDDAAGADATARTVAKSVWGVVPTPPARKADLRPALIEGAAVAVGDQTLLASCEVIGRRTRVGLVRHNKYRIARVGAADPERRVCELAVDEGPLAPIAGRRSFADLEVGEAVYAFTSRTSADLDLARGWIAGKSPAGEAFLETTLVLPASAQSAVLFDADGNLVGLAAAAPAPDSLVLATPLADALAPQVALRDGDVAPPFLLLASLGTPPRDRARVPPVRFPLAPDRDDDPSGTVATRTEPTRTATAGPAAKAGTAAGGPVGSQPSAGGAAPAGPTVSDRPAANRPSPTTDDRDRRGAAEADDERAERAAPGRGAGRGREDDDAGRGRGRGRGGERSAGRGRDDDDDDRGRGGGGGRGGDRGSDDGGDDD